MKIALINRERLLSLGQFLVDELDSLVARIRASWNVEHTPDGAHGHVHAETVSTGRITYSDIVSAEVGDDLSDFDPGGLSTAAMLRLSTTLPIVNWGGLRVPQDESGAVIDGRVIVIENITTTAYFRIIHEHTASVPRNRFSIPWLPASGFQYLVLAPGCIVTMIYSAERARWVVCGATNDTLTSQTTISSNQNDFSPTRFRESRIVRLVPTTSGLTISGFESRQTNTNVVFPSTKTITNEGIYAIDILHQNTGSNSLNRVQCPGGIRYRLNPRESIELHHGTATGWQILLKADQWVDVTFAAGNFTSNSGSWTVGSTDQITYSYQIDGNMMTVAWELHETTIVGAPTDLRIAIPNGRTPRRRVTNRLGLAFTGGAHQTNAFCFVLPGITYITLVVDLLGTAWGAGANNAYLSGEIVFMIGDDCAAISELHTDDAHADTAHADADHSDVAHVDTAHADSHSDTAHSDGFHSDIAHSDTAHDDVAHVDVEHGDSHSDVAHSDTAHVDTPGGHEDVAHEDHTDEGTNPEHTDEAHQDETIPHDDTAHADVTHEDVAHVDTAHSDVAHVDVAHVDVAHSDSAHGDTAHADSHSDTPHSDTAHADGGHGDTEHADTAHQDVGFHCDTAHSDI